MLRALASDHRLEAAAGPVAGRSQVMNTYVALAETLTRATLYGAFSLSGVRPTPAAVCTLRTGTAWTLALLLTGAAVSVQYGSTVYPAVHDPWSAGRHLGWVSFDGAQVMVGVDSAAPARTQAVTDAGFTWGTLSLANQIVSFGGQGLDAIAYPVAHTAAQRARVLAWLAQRYGAALY